MDHLKESHHKLNFGSKMGSLEEESPRFFDCLKYKGKLV